jgi:predicted DNA-binding transcriptional regulator AlpA
LAPTNRRDKRAQAAKKRGKMEALKTDGDEEEAGPSSIPPDAPQPLPRLVAFDELRPLGVLLSKRQIDRLEACDKFPRRTVMSPARVGWVTAEIIAFVDAAIAARSTKKGTLGSGDMMRRPPYRTAPMLGPKTLGESRKPRRASREAESTA